VLDRILKTEYELKTLQKCSKSSSSQTTATHWQNIAFIRISKIFQLKVSIFCIRT